MGPKKRPGWKQSRQPWGNPPCRCASCIAADAGREALRERLNAELRRTIARRLGVGREKSAA